MFSQPDYIKINGLSADRHPNLDEEERNADDDGRPFDATFHGTLSKAVSELLREFSATFFYYHFSRKNEEIKIFRDGSMKFDRERFEWSS